jgi:type II secretory pathway pseudopilin PulG
MAVKKTFTLTEIIVGSIILASIFGGLVASFVATRRYVNRANTRLISANLARSVLNGLYNEVRQDTYDTGGLSVGTHNNVINVSIDNHQYTGDYEVSSIDINGDGTPDRDYRRVIITVNYPIE